MRILIIEDEPPVAEEIEELVRSILRDEIDLLKVVYTFEEALGLLKHHVFDLCFLDLNLSGSSGFDILKQTVSGNFQTIIISAYTDQAIEAFKYGVLDFVPKPVDADRLRVALDRYFGKTENNNLKAKYIVVKKGQMHKIIPLNKILFFKAEGYLIDIFLKDGQKEITEKSLNHLEQILPINFIRVHRSYIVDLNEINYYRHKAGSVYEIYLKNKIVIPLSYSKYKILKKLVDKNTSKNIP